MPPAVLNLSHRSPRLTGLTDLTVSHSPWELLQVSVPRRRLRDELVPQPLLGPIFGRHRRAHSDLRANSRVLRHRSWTCHDHRLGACPGTVVTIDTNDVFTQYHAPYTTVLENFLRPGAAGPPPMSDSGLINGRGRFNCSLVQPDPVTGEVAACEPDAPYSAFRFQSGKTHRLRLINHGAAGECGIEQTCDQH